MYLNQVKCSQSLISASLLVPCSSFKPQEQMIFSFLLPRYVLLYIFIVHICYLPLHTIQYFNYLQQNILLTLVHFQVICSIILRYRKLKAAHLEEQGKTNANSKSSNLSLLLEAWKPISIGYKRRQLLMLLLYILSRDIILLVLGQIYNILRL